MHISLFRSVRIAAVSTSFFALAACGSPSQEGGQDASTSNPPSPSSASSSASNSSTSTSMGTVLSTEGIGPVTFGMTTSEAAEALGAPLGPEDMICQESPALPNIVFLVGDGTVVGAGSFGALPPSELHTDRGISGQSTQDELFAAYPTEMTTEQSSGDMYTTISWWTNPEGGEIQFSYTDTPGMSMFAGDYPGGNDTEFCIPE